MRYQPEGATFPHASLRDSSSRSIEPKVLQLKPHLQYVYTSLGILRSKIVYAVRRFSLHIHGAFFNVTLATACSKSARAKCASRALLNRKITIT